MSPDKKGPPDPEDLREDWKDVQWPPGAGDDAQHSPDHNEPRELTDHWHDLTERPEIPPMGDKELVEFVLGVCDGRIFTLQHIRPGEREHIAPVVFLPLILGAFSNWFSADFEQIGMVWEYLSAAGPRGINGYPIFSSMHVMTAADWKRAVRAIERETERRKAATSILDDLKEEPTP